LNELQSYFQRKQIGYWRDKQGNEIDFVIEERGRHPVAIECKWSGSAVNPSGFKAFRKIYPKGSNFIIAADIDKPSVKHYGELKCEFIPLRGLIKKISNEQKTFTTALPPDF
jgi:predicted AAA+ superfamily ATPase